MNGGIGDLGAQALWGLSEEGREKSRAHRETLPVRGVGDVPKPEELWSAQNLRRGKLALHSGPWPV